MAVGANIPDLAALYERVANRSDARVRVLTGAKSSASPVGFDERTCRGIQEPAGFGVSSVDQARSKDVAPACCGHRRVIQDDVQGIAHRAATRARRRSSSPSRSRCSAAVGA